MKLVVVNEDALFSMLRVWACTTYENCENCEDRHACMTILEDIDTEEGMKAAIRYLNIQPFPQERNLLPEKCCCGGDMEDYQEISGDAIKNYKQCTKCGREEGE